MQVRVLQTNAWPEKVRADQSTAGEACGSALAHSPGRRRASDPLPGDDHLHHGRAERPGVETPPLMPLRAQAYEAFYNSKHNGRKLRPDQDPYEKPNTSPKAPSCFLVFPLQAVQ